MELAGLAETLAGGEFTVFAPTNMAISKVCTAALGFDWKVIIIPSTATYGNVGCHTWRPRSPDTSEAVMEI